MEKSSKFAFVTIIGRPSVGKSTLLNKMCGEKVAIVSKVPQTTRNAIRGIVNRQNGQLVFIDTPGRHTSQKKINKKLKEVSERALNECDLVLYVMDASRAPGAEEEEITSLLAPLAEKTIIAVNKIDVPGADISRSKKYIEQRFPKSLRASASLRDFSEPLCASVPPREVLLPAIFPISAATGEGIEELLTALFETAPEGEMQYGEDYYTDQGVSFRIAEIIRGQAINRLREELPHCLFVDIADIEFKEQENSLWVRAFLVVERESQKGMVVGKGGEMIKKIRLASLKELKRIFDWKIELDLRVKASKDWRSKDQILHRIIDR